MSNSNAGIINWYWNEEDDQNEEVGKFTKKAELRDELERKNRYLANVDGARKAGEEETGQGSTNGEKRTMQGHVSVTKAMQKEDEVQRFTKMETAKDIEELKCCGMLDEKVWKIKQRENGSDKGNVSLSKALVNLDSMWAHKTLEVNSAIEKHWPKAQFMIQLYHLLDQEASGDLKMVK